MARRIIANSLSTFGSSLFSILSRCEEKGLLPGLSRILKTSILGLTVSAIASCCKIIPPLVTCYKPAVVHPRISELEISPNPTNGAEKVKISAKATLIDLELDSTAYISSARCTLDTLSVEMKPVDGAFDEVDEELEVELTLPLKPCTTLVHVFVESNIETVGSETEYLYITSEDN